MQCPPMDPKPLKWEKFKAFHVEHTRNHSCQIYQFDTGEVVILTSQPEPNARIRYPKLGLRIVSTIDDRFPALVTPEGVPVSRAHLIENGNQCLLIDEETRRVVHYNVAHRLQSGGRRGFRSASLRVPACGALPRGSPGRGVMRSPPRRSRCHSRGRCPPRSERPSGRWSTAA